MSPLSTVCKSHGAWLAQVSMRALAGIQHAGDLDRLVDQLAVAQRPEDEPAGARDAILLQDLCTQSTAVDAPWGEARPHDLIRIVDEVARELIQARAAGSGVAHALRCPPEERVCFSSWSAPSIKRLASMSDWPDGALAWVCLPAAELVRQQDRLLQELSISPRYFKACAALFASLR